MLANLYLQYMRLWLLLLCTLLANSSFAQSRIKFADFFWPEKDISLLVPEEFQDEDAVIMERKARWDLYRRPVEENFNFLQYYYRYRFLSYEGTHTYGYGIISILEGARITRVDMRISHPDGTSSDLRAKSLKKFIDPRGTEEFPPDKFILIKVPVLQPGDELEIFYQYDGLPLPSQSFFHDFLPIVKSDIILSHDDFETLVYATYNGLNQPELSEELHVVNVHWTDTKVPVYADEFNVVKQNHIPFIVHAFQPAFVKDRDLKLNWSAYGTQTKFIAEAFADSYDAKLEQYLAECWAGIPFEDKWNRIRSVHERVNKNVLVHTRNNERLSLGYSLYNKSIHYDDLILFYVDLFERLEMPYTVGLGRDNGTGALDTSFISLAQVTHYGFRWETRDNEYAFVFPKRPEAAYQFNELPYELYGTNMVLLQTKRPFYSSYIEIPHRPTRENRMEWFGKLNVESNYLAAETKLTASGEWVPYFRYGQWRKYQDAPDEIFFLHGGCWEYNFDAIQPVSKEKIEIPLTCDQAFAKDDSSVVIDLGQLFPLFPLPINTETEHDQKIHFPHLQLMNFLVESPSNEMMAELPEDDTMEVEGIGRFSIHYVAEDNNPHLIRIHAELEIYRQDFSASEVRQLYNLITFAQSERIIRFTPTL